MGHFLRQDPGAREFRVWIDPLVLCMNESWPQLTESWHTKI